MTDQQLCIVTMFVRNVYRDLELKGKIDHSMYVAHYRWLIFITYHMSLANSFIVFRGSESFPCPGTAHVSKLWKLGVSQKVYTLTLLDSGKLINMYIR